MATANRPPASAPARKQTSARTDALTESPLAPAIANARNTTFPGHVGREDVSEAQKGDGVDETGRCRQEQQRGWKQVVE